MSASSNTLKIFHWHHKDCFLYHDFIAIGGICFNKHTIYLKYMLWFHRQVFHTNIIDLHIQNSLSCSNSKKSLFFPNIWFIDSYDHEKVPDLGTDGMHVYAMSDNRAREWEKWKGRRSSNPPPPPPEICQMWFEMGIGDGFYDYWVHLFFVFACKLLHINYFKFVTIDSSSRAL